MKTNKLFDYSDFSDIDFVKVQKEIGEFGSDSRKSWEFVTITYGLKPFFSNDKVALGLGCLKERLIYFYTNKFKHTYVTDVAYYPRDDKRLKLWGEEGYSVDEVYESEIPYSREKLTVLPMDMMDIEFPDNTFDVVWSASSVEHVGELSEVLKCFEEVQRVLKPNGVFSITTEWNLDYPDTKAVKFANVQSFDFYVLDKISEVTPKLKLIEPLSLERSDNYKNKEKEYQLGKSNNFYGDAIDYTSVSLVWRKE